jgi:hypothetical protein
MNCTIARRRLLSAEQPAVPAADLQAHLDGCADCRDWQTRLVQVERAVPTLPVPRTSAHLDLLHLILTTPPTQASQAVQRPEPLLSVVPLDDAPQPAPRRAPAAPRRLSEQMRSSLPAAWRQLRQHSHALAGLAAALALVLTLWALPRTSQPNQTPIAREAPRHHGPDPLVASMMQCNLRLAGTNNAKDRAIAVARLERDLRDQSRSLVRLDDAAEMIALLDGLRDKVVGWLGKHGQEIKPAVELPGNADAERLQQLQRNREIIVALVESGLKLAGLEDSLRRAEACNEVASLLADQVREAVARREASRSQEMGQHLSDLLRVGVAENIAIARRDSHDTEAREASERIGVWVADLVEPLEASLAEAVSTADSSTAPAMKRTLHLVLSGRREVELAVRG